MCQGDCILVMSHYYTSIIKKARTGVMRNKAMSGIGQRQSSPARAFSVCVVVCLALITIPILPQGVYVCQVKVILSEKKVHLFCSEHTEYIISPTIK